MYDVSAVYQANTLAEAIRFRSENPEAVIIAGGTDVLVQLRAGKMTGATLLSIHDCNELHGICMDEKNSIRIGSLCTFSEIMRDPIIQNKFSVLGEAAGTVGGPQIRNAGTIGGNICNGVTSADTAATLLAWDAIVEVTGKTSVRRIPVQDFYVSAGKVDLRPENGEIQTAIIIPEESYERTFGKYIKYAVRSAMDIATLGTSANVRLSRQGNTFERVRIAFGVAGPVPMRAPTAEKYLIGKAVTSENIEAFSHLILEDIRPRDSWRASEEFRKHIAVENAKQSLIDSIRIAGGVM